MAKWAASSNPDSAATAASRRDSARSSRRYRTSAIGATMAVANTLRQNAMASGGAWARRMKIAEKETATTPPASAT